jgi:hypothetical protein
MNDDTEELRAEMDRLRARIEQLEHRERPQERAGPRIFLASRSGAQWQERAINAGAIVDFIDGRKVEADDAVGAVINRGSSVFLYETEDAEGMRYVEIGGGPIPVICSTDGGDPGDAEALERTSYTYTLYEQDGVTVIAEGVELEGNGHRIVCAAMSPGSRGLAYVDDEGEWKLLFVDEIFTQYNCDFEEEE